jgi:penicillin-binding protein 1C
LLCLLLAVVVVLAAAVWRRSELRAPPSSQLLLDRHGTFLAQVGGGETADFGYWPVDPVPERVAAAILAVEDHRFAHHPGIDPVAMVRAVGERLLGRKHSGASTIAMQVARMQDPGPRTAPKKAMEALTAVAMTLRYGRDAVLRQYLRLVPFGNGSHGIAHAARWYLDKPVVDLSWAEIAFLAAIPQAPGRMSPFAVAGNSRAVQRGHKVLARLRQQGVIGDEEFHLAELQIGHLAIPERSLRPAEAMHAVLRLQRMLRQQPAADPRVVTTLDLELQQRVQAVADRSMGEWRQRGAEQVAVIVQARASHEVLAWLGSSSYASPNAGAMDFTGVSRSPGSALKPFLYALALDQGRMAANTVLADLPEVQWGIENADHDYLGPMLPRQALATSRNVPATQVLKRTGLDEAYQFLGQLGLHNNRRTASHYGLVLAVGAMDTTLERLITAYGVLADDGWLARPVWWRGQPTQPPRRVLSAAVARQITLFLADPMARLPTFPRLGANEEGVPIAVKTGTSQGYRDAWAVAWTNDTIVGVWVGRARGTSMRAMTGAQSAAKLAEEVLLDIHHRSANSGGKSAAFPPPDGFSPVELCAHTGLRAAGRCDRTLTEYFAEGHPPEEDDVFQTLRIDLRNGLLAAPWTPARYVGDRTFAALPSDQAAWGKLHALPPPPLDLSPLDRPGRQKTPTASPPGAELEAPSLKIVAPHDGLRMVRNPETPPDADLIGLRVNADRRVTSVVWWVDGQVWRQVGVHEAVNWPLTAGVHAFEVTTPDGSARSKPVTITVQ